VSTLRQVLEPLRPHVRPLRAFLVALLLTHAWFLGTPGWNQNSRLALTRALVERGSIVIDDFADTTGDRSFRGGHWYCDKAPGASILAAPAYAILVAVRWLAGNEAPEAWVRPADRARAAADAGPDSLAARGPGDRIVYNAAHRLALWVCALATGGSTSLLACLALWLAAVRLGVTRSTTLVAVAAAHALGTLALPYGSAFYGHAPAANLLFTAFVVAWLAPGSAPRAVGIAVGALAGIAVVCEYPVAPVAAVIAGIHLVRQGRAGVLPLLLGSAPPALLLAAYHTAAFGHPLRTGYDFLVLPEFAEGMRERYGFAAPSLGVARELFVGTYRGLFYLCPATILATWGLVRSAWTARGDDRLGLVLAGVIVLYLAGLASAYFMWDGGAAFGPRHLVPALPFLALGLPAAARELPRAFAVLAGVGIIHMVLAAAAGPEAPRHGNPIFDYALPRVLAAGGDATIAPTHLGTILGLPGLLGLVPLGALWLVALAELRRAAAASEAQHEGAGPTPEAGRG
jgi:hypothetical protein